MSEEALEAEIAYHRRERNGRSNPTPVDERDIRPWRKTVEDTEERLEESPSTDLEIKKPRPVHERIILLHFLNHPNTVIAEQVGMTSNHVARVISSPWGMTRIEELKERMRENLLSDIEGQMVDLAHKSMKNLERTVNAPISPLHHMKKHQDNLGLELLSRIGYDKKSDRSPGDERGIRLSEEAGNRLAAALERANRVREEESKVVEEPDYEIVEAETSTALATVPDSPEED